MRKALIALLLSLLASPYALALRPSDLPVSVVKVASSVRGASAPHFGGSGLLLRVGRDVYVLTSEHVLPHSLEQDRFSIELSNPAIGSRPARLVSVEWGNGLALLRMTSELPASLSDRLPTLSDLAAARSGDAVQTAGFPRRSNSMIQDMQAVVLNSRSQRHRMPLLESCLELSDAHGEFGMSGGPVFNSAGTAVVGILSHQFLKMIPGQSTRSEEFSNSLHEIQNQLIAIPAVIAKNWLESSLRAPISHFVRDPQEQLQGRTAVYSQGLRFETITSDSPDAAVIGGSDGVGIGGTDGVGIGGSDGVGIGGTDGVGIGGAPVNTPRAVAKVGRVSALSSEASSRLIPTSWPQLWDSNVPRLLLERLRLQDALLIPFFTASGSPELLLDPVRFGTLEEMIDDLGAPSLQPVLILRDRAAQLTSELMQRGERLRSAAQPLVSDPQSPEGTLLLNRIQDLATLIRSSAAAQVNAQAIRAILDDRRGWDSLFENRFNETVTLMRETRQLLRALERR